MSNKKIIGGLCTLVLFSAIFYVAYSGKGSTYFSFLKHLPGGDKTGHVFLLFILSFALTWLSSFRSFQMKRLRMFYGIFATFTFITIEEFLQVLSPYRSFDLIDLMCNYLGIALAQILVMVLHKKLNQQAPMTEVTPVDPVKVQGADAPHP